MLNVTRFFVLKALIVSLCLPTLAAKTTQKVILQAQEKKIATSSISKNNLRNKKNYLLAQNNTSTKSTLVNSSMSTSTANESVESKRTSISLRLDYSSNLYADTEPARERNFGFLAIPAFKISEFWSLSSRISVSKQVVGPENSELANIPAGLSYNRFKLFESIDIKNKISITTPTNQELREQDSYRGGVSLGTDFTYKTHSKILPTSFTYGISLIRSIHEFEVNSSGSPNIQYTLRNDFIIDTGITENLSLSFSGVLRQARTYNDYQRESFISEIEMAYSVTPAWSVFAGTSNEGNTLKANGRESNITYYNENTSFLYMGMGYSY